MSLSPGPGTISITELTQAVRLFINERQRPAEGQPVQETRAVLQGKQKAARRGRAPKRVRKQ